MNANEHYFRRTAGAIGGALLLMLVLLHGFPLVISLFWTLISALSLSTVAIEILYQMFYCLGYLACFILPALMLRHLIRRAGYFYRPMQTAVKFSPWWLLAIPIGVALVFAASHFNVVLADDFIPLSYLEDMTWGARQVALEPYELVLQFLTVCIVPGFCEEFLFRGAILENCLPFGRTRAIFISALLFSLMHQDPVQIFYTFVAGILFGVVYERTRSIWLVILMHIFNNFVSLAQEFISYRLPDDVWMTAVLWMLEILVFVAGAVSMAVLIKRGSSSKPDFSEGVFGRSAESVDVTEDSPIAEGRAVKLFLHPAMLFFIAFSGMQVFMRMLLNGVL